MRLARSIEAGEEVEWASWLAKNEEEVRRRLCEMSGLDTKTVLDPSAVTHFVIRLTQGELGTPEQLRIIRETITDARVEAEP